MADLRVICLVNGMFAENCYVVADVNSSRAVLIDPGEDAQLFLRTIDEENLQLEAIWLTHAHIDHIMGVADVVEATGVDIYLHPADRPLYDGIEQQGAWMGLRSSIPPPPDRDIVVGETLSVGDLNFGVRLVPGHSPGSVALVGHGVAFVGDALFQGSVGRVDLPGGDGATLLNSIESELLTLPDETVVYSGHGAETTIGVERRTNPFLTGAASIV